MKRFLILLAGLGTLLLAAAQQSTSYDPQAAERERARIEAERRQALERYGQEEADCYQRFSVNDCLSDMRKRRRVALEELRRQEIILGDERRAALAAEKIHRAEAQAAERASAQAQEQREAAQKADQERRQRARQKQATQIAPAPGGAASAPARPASAPASAAAEAAQRAALQRAYEERQRQAEERRKERERAQSGKVPGTSRPLPVPP